VIEIHSSKD